MKQTPKRDFLLEQYDQAIENPIINQKELYKLIKKCYKNNLYLIINDYLLDEKGELI